MSENNQEPQFYIINDTDRPGRRAVAQLLDKETGLAKYISHELRDWGELTVTDKSTNVKDFGFNITFKDGIASFEKTSEGVATYNDGNPRYWQGQEEFSLYMKITDATNVIEETEEPITDKQLDELLVLVAINDTTSNKSLPEHPCGIAIRRLSDANNRANECNELIATLAIKNSKLLQTAEKCLQSNVFIQNLLTNIGGPLNDNKQGYTRDQLAIFRQIHELIQQAVE